MGEAVDQSSMRWLRPISAPWSPICEASFQSHQPIYRPSLRRLLRLRRNATAEAVGKRIFEGACVHCHDWTGVSQISPFATIAGARGVNDRTATNVVQIAISGTKRHTPDGVISMPAFGSAYSDSEIAAVANYVTARFGSAPSKLTDKDVAELRSQAAD